MLDTQAPATPSWARPCAALLVPAGLVASPLSPVARPAEPPPAAQEAAIRALHPELDPEAVGLRRNRVRLAWERLHRQGIAKDAAWRESVQEGRLEILGRAYLDRLPGHPGLSEAQVQASFLAQGDLRRVSHVMCSTEGEAAAALARIKGGEPFERVAAELSKDPSAKDNLGLLGWIRRRDMVAEFGTPVFEAAVGDLVGPMKSQFGWHVAKVWEAKALTPADFQAQRETLLRQAGEAQLALKREKALVALRRQYPLRADLDVLGMDRTTEPMPGDEAKVAGRVAGATLSLKALKVHLYQVLKTMGQSHSLGAATKARFMEGLADGHRLAAAAVKQGLDRQARVAAALWADERERAYAEYARRYLETVPVPEAELQSFHRSQPDLFRSVGGIRLQVLVAETRDRVDEALNQVRLGMPWRQAATRFGNPETTGDPEPGWVEVEDLRKLVPPSLLAPLLGGELGQPVGPMLGPDGYMIFNALERRPGPRLPFEACRDAVRSAYLRAEGRRLVDESLDRPIQP